MNVMMKWLLGSVLLTMVSFAHAQNVNGILRVVKGDVQIKSGKNGATTKARIGQQVFPKDVIITGKDARAKIVMVDNNEINVSPESQIEIQHYEYDPNAGKKDVLLNVIYGKVRAKVEQKYDGKTSKFQVKTPSAVAGVRGTDFLTSYDRKSDASQVVTFRGAVEFGLPGANGTINNPVSVTPGKVAESSGGQAPAPPTAMPKEQLAKMDNDTKADTGGAKPDGAGKNERAPSNDGDKDKKDDGAKKDGAKKDGGAKGTGPSGGATADGGKNTDGSRAPSAVESPGAGPTSGDQKGSTLMASDMPSNAPPPPPPQMQQPITIDIPKQPGPQLGQTPCAVCNQLLQNGNSNLTIHVKTQ